MFVNVQSIAPRLREGNEHWKLPIRAALTALATQRR
jgi:hypothetical protein